VANRPVTDPSRSQTEGTRIKSTSGDKDRFIVIAAPAWDRMAVSRRPTLENVAMHASAASRRIGFL